MQTPIVATQMSTKEDDSPTFISGICIFCQTHTDKRRMGVIVPLSREFPLKIVV